MNNRTAMSNFPYPWDLNNGYRNAKISFDIIDRNTCNIISLARHLEMKNIVSYLYSFVYSFVAKSFENCITAPLLTKRINIKSFFSSPTLQ